MDQIVENGSQPGIFIEVDEIIDDEVLSLIFKKYKLGRTDGCSVGFGGQFFNEQTASYYFKKIFLKRK